MIATTVILLGVAATATDILACYILATTAAELLPYDF
jgi:hypothetical protein